MGSEMCIRDRYGGEHSTAYSVYKCCSCFKEYDTKHGLTTHGKAAQASKNIRACLKWLWLGYKRAKQAKEEGIPLGLFEVYTAIIIMGHDISQAHTHIPKTKYTIGCVD